MGRVEERRDTPDFILTDLLVLLLSRQQVLATRGIQTSYEVDLAYSVGRAEDGKWK